MSNLTKAFDEVFKDLRADPYASEEETKALLVPDTRSEAERKLAAMMAERGADEQGAEPSLILRQIALGLLEAQTFTGLPKRKLSELVSAGWNINGVSIEREEGGVTKRGAVTTGGMVLWWNQEPTGSMGMPESCGKPLCSPGDHHPLCKLAEQPAQQTCNCRWRGEVQVQECTLHESHLLAIHEWAGRAKAAEAKLKEQPAQQEPVAWVPYLSDRADGVKGHYAIARWNPRGYREVWNLRRHEWGACSDDVLSLEEADTLLRLITIPTRKVTSSQPAQPQQSCYCLNCEELSKELTDEAINAAVKAWFEHHMVNGRQPFAKRMRAAIKAAQHTQHQAQKIMETFDAVTLFLSGVSLGLIIGHWFCKRTDVPLAYQRGRADGFNELWPHVVRCWVKDIQSGRVASAPSEANGGAGSDTKTVH